MLLQIDSIDHQLFPSCLIHLPGIPARGDYLQLTKVAFPLRVKQVLLHPLNPRMVATIQVRRARSDELLRTVEGSVGPKQWEQCPRSRKRLAGVSVQLRGEREAGVSLARIPQRGDTVLIDGELLQIVSRPLSGVEAFHVFVEPATPERTQELPLVKTLNRKRAYSGGRRSLQ